MTKNLKLLVLLFVVTSALSGCSDSIPNCGDELVKKEITNHFSTVLYDLGIPDLSDSILSKKISFKVDQITESFRNKESKYTQCNGVISISFPENDLNAARKNISAIVVPKDSIFTSNINYTASAPADKKEKGNGPIVEITKKGLNILEKKITPYIQSYELLTLNVLDIDSDNKNLKKWSNEFKNNATTACSENGAGISKAQCQCIMNGIEDKVPESDFRKIAYSINSKPLTGFIYKNFITSRDEIVKECKAK